MDCSRERSSQSGCLRIEAGAGAVYPSIQDRYLSGSGLAVAIAIANQLAKAIDRYRHDQTHILMLGPAGARQFCSLLDRRRRACHKLPIAMSDTGAMAPAASTLYPAHALSDMCILIMALLPERPWPPHQR